MKRTQKFLILLLVLTLGFFALLILNVKINADVIPYEAFETDESYGEIKTSKNYDSNIPSEAYDVNNGALSSNQEGNYITTYVDLIRGDGQFNYAFPANQFVQIPLNQSITFYIETAFDGWYMDGALPKGVYDLELSGEGISYTFDSWDGRSYYINQFDSNTSGTTFHFEDNLSEYGKDNTTLYMNSNYRLPKVTITADEEGLYSLTINCKSQLDNSGYEETIIYFHVYDGDLPNYFDLQIAVNTGEDQPLDYYQVDLEEQVEFVESVALPYDLTNSYVFKSNFLQLVNGTTVMQSNVGYVTIKQDQGGNNDYVADRNPDDDLVIYFNNPGIYELILDFHVKSNEGPDAEVGTRLFNVLVYSRDNIALFDSESEEYDSISVPLDEVNNLSFYPFTPEFDSYENLSVYWTATNKSTQSTTSLGNISTSGEYTLNGSFTDTALESYYESNQIEEPTVASTFSNSWDMEVTSTNRPDIELSFDEMVIEQESSYEISYSELFNNDFYVVNYDEIVRAGGTISYMYGRNEISLNSDHFSLVGVLPGQQSLMMKVEYDDIISSYYSLNIINDLTFVIKDGDNEISSLQMEVFDESKYLDVIIKVAEEYYELPAAFNVSVESSLDYLTAYFTSDTNKIYVSSPSDSESGTFEILVYVQEDEQFADFYFDVSVNALPELSLVVIQNDVQTTNISIQPDYTELFDVLLVIDGNAVEVTKPYNFQIENIDNPNLVELTAANVASGEPNQGFYVTSNENKGSCNFDLVLYKNFNEVITIPVTLTVENIQYEWAAEIGSGIIQDIYLTIGDSIYTFYVRGYISGSQIPVSDFDFSNYTLMPDSGLLVENVESDEGTNQFNVEALMAGEYVLSIDVKLGDETVGGLEIPIYVSAPAIVLKHNDENIESIDVVNNTTESVDVYYAINGDESLIDQNYKFNVTTDASHFTVNKVELGDGLSSSFIIEPLSVSSVGTGYVTIELLDLEDNVLDTRSLRVEIVDVGYNQEMKYHFVNDQQDVIDTVVELEYHESQYIEVIAEDGQNMISFDERYEIRFESSNEEGLHFALSNDAVSPITSGTIFGSKAGTYTLLAKIYYLGDLKDTIVLSAHVGDEPTLGIILKQDNVEINTLTVANNSSATIDVYLSYGDEQALIVEPYQFELSYSYDLLNVEKVILEGKASTSFTVTSLSSTGMGRGTIVVFIVDEEGNNLISYDLPVEVVDGGYDDDNVYQFIGSDGYELGSYLELEYNVDESIMVVVNGLSFDERYAIEFTTNNQNALSFTPMEGIGEPVNAGTIKGIIPGTYTFMAKISYLGELKEVLVLTVHVNDKPLPEIILKNDNEYISSVTLSLGDSVSLTTFVLFESVESPLQSPYSIQLNNIDENLNVYLSSSNTTPVVIDDMIDDMIVITDKGVSGTYSFTVELYELIDGVNTLVQTRTVSVNILDDDINYSEYSFYFKNGNDIVSTLVLQENDSAILDLYYSLDGEEYLASSDFTFDLISSDLEYLTAMYERHQFIISSSNKSGLYAVTANIYVHERELVSTIILPIQVGKISGDNEPITFNGYFYFEKYEYTLVDGEELSIPLYYYDSETSQSRIFNDSKLTLKVLQENYYFELFFDETDKVLRVMPRSSGVSPVDVLVIYDNQFITNIRISVRVIFNRESIETSFAEGKMVQALLDNGEIYLTIPQEYQDLYYNGEIINISSNRNVCDVIEMFDHRLLVQLINVGQSDVYLVLRNEYQQVLFKSTLSVINEEPHIEIDMRRETESDSAISKFDNLTFSVNTLGFTFSSSISYEWLLDDQVVGHDEKLTTTIPDGTHNITVRFVDNVLNRHLEASKVLNISKLPDQKRQLSFEENTIYLVMLKNSYDLQVLLDGMVANDYKYSWSSDNDTVTLYENGTSKVTLLPNHAGTTTVYAFVDVGVGEEKIISASITVIVEKLESIDFELSQEFPKPNKPFDIIFIANGRKDFKNTDFQCDVSLNGEAVNTPNDGNIFHITEPVNGKYDFTYRLGNLEKTASIKVSNFNFREFLMKILPYVLIGMVLAVIVYTFIVRSLNPYRNLTSAVTSLETTFQKAIEKTDNNPNLKAYGNAFKKLRRKVHDLMNRINYFSDEGFDGIENATKSVITLDTILSSLVHSLDSISESDCGKALHNMYDKNFAALKILINQIIDSQLHYQKQVRENNTEEPAKTRKQKKAEKAKIDYKKELYRNGVLEQGDTEDND